MKLADKNKQRTVNIQRDAQITEHFGEDLLREGARVIDEEKLAASIRHILLSGYANIPQNNGMILDEKTKDELYQELQKQFLFNMQFRKVIIQQVEELVKLFQSVKPKK